MRFELKSMNVPLYKLKNSPNGTSQQVIERIKKEKNGERELFDDISFGFGHIELG